MTSLRNASTVIIVHKFPFMESSKFNYKIFLLKRSSESKFMPNVYVFPGGVFDNDDESPDWNNFYKHLNAKNQKFVPSKLTAIREVFEESGLLISSPIIDKNQVDPKEYSEWRQIVHSDATRFKEFCSKYKTVPNMNALHLFSQWTTPKQEKRRYNTDFYLTKIDRLPDMIHDGVETTKSSWMSPEEALESFAKGEISLAPPTWYTIQEIYKFCDIENLMKYVASKNIECWEPTLSKIDGKLVVALPGDPLHQASPGAFQHRIVLEKKGEYQYIKSKM